jgi:hypothetical protein
LKTSSRDLWAVSNETFKNLDRFSSELASLDPVRVLPVRVLSRCPLRSHSFSSNRTPYAPPCRRDQCRTWKAGTARRRMRCPRSPRSGIGWEPPAGADKNGVINTEVVGQTFRYRCDRHHPLQLPPPAVPPLHTDSAARQTTSDTYPGTKGNTQGDRNETSPAKKAAIGTGRVDTCVLIVLVHAHGLHSRSYNSALMWLL